MTREDIALRKLDTLMRAVSKQDETLDELKDAAFEVLLLNHGSEQSDWAKTLVEQYGTARNLSTHTVQTLPRYTVRLLTFGNVHTTMRTSGRNIVTKNFLWPSIIY